MFGKAQVIVIFLLYEKPGLYGRAPDIDGRYLQIYRNKPYANLRIGNDNQNKSFRIGEFLIFDYHRQ